MNNCHKSLDHSVLNNTIITDWLDHTVLKNTIVMYGLDHSVLMNTINSRLAVLGKFLQLEKSTPQYQEVQLKIPICSAGPSLPGE